MVEEILTSLQVLSGLNDGLIRTFNGRKVEPHLTYSKVLVPVINDGPPRDKKHELIYENFSVIETPQSWKLLALSTRQDNGSRITYEGDLMLLDYNHSRWGRIDVHRPRWSLAKTHEQFRKLGEDIKRQGGYFKRSLFSVMDGGRLFAPKTSKFSPKTERVLEEIPNGLLMENSEFDRGLVVSSRTEIPVTREFRYRPEIVDFLTEETKRILES